MHGKAANSALTCRYCGELVDPNNPHSWQRYEGWGRVAGRRASGSHGGVDSVMRVWAAEFAHDECVQLEKRGVNVRQETLV